MGFKTESPCAKKVLTGAQNKVDACRESFSGGSKLSLDMLKMVRHGSKLNCQTLDSGFGCAKNYAENLGTVNQHAKKGKGS